MKNSPEFYGEDYLNIEIGGAGGAKRNEDNGAYYQAAVFVREFLDFKEYQAPRTLDVGCGLGFVVRHLRNLNVDAHGVEYGFWTVDHAVVPGILWADLTIRLPFPSESFDLVSCCGVLSQFPEEFSEGALRELARVSRRFVWVNIQCEEHELQRHHRNIKPKEFWFDLFEKTGLRIVEEEFLLANYYRVPSRCCRILEK